MYVLEKDIGILLDISTRLSESCLRLQIFEISLMVLPLNLVCPSLPHLREECFTLLQGPAS